jgi:uncharacterized protein (DUF1501 family)
MRSFDSNRRNFLKTSALSAGGLFLGSLFSRRADAAAAAANRKYVFAYFEGGWDIMLGLDPKDPAMYTPAANQIDPGYGQLTAAYQARGVQRKNALAFGPAVPTELLAHSADMSIVNAISMDTASHEAGRRYFITGRFPRGITAVGSSTPAEIVAQVGDKSPIPHISAGVEAYAENLPAYASALNINSIADLAVALTPFVNIDPKILASVQDYQDKNPGCEGTRLDRDGLVTNLLRSQKRARDYIKSQLDRVFDVYNRTDSEMTALKQLYDLQGTNLQPDSPEIMAFIAGQAIKANMCQCVSVRIAMTLDTHSNWAQDQAPRQERGWKALAALISDLKASEVQGTAGSGSAFDQTTILAFSEFGRTPMFNNLRGRDHFLGNSCLLAGAGFKKGLTIGKSASVGMLPLATDLSTGQGVEMPSDAQIQSGMVTPLSPKHVLATILGSAGLDASYLRTPPIAALEM